MRDLFDHAIVDRPWGHEKGYGFAGVEIGGKRVLVTGAGGTIGAELAKILDMAKSLILRGTDSPAMVRRLRELGNFPRGVFVCRG